MKLSAAAQRLRELRLCVGCTAPTGSGAIGQGAATRPSRWHHTEGATTLPSLTKRGVWTFPDGELLQEGRQEDSVPVYRGTAEFGKNAEKLLVTVKGNCRTSSHVQELSTDLQWERKSLFFSLHSQTCSPLAGESTGCPGSSTLWVFFLSSAGPGADRHLFSALIKQQPHIRLVIPRKLTFSAAALVPF